MRRCGENGIAGEVVVADNGSTDGSQQIALDHGARLVPVPIRGYGAALNAGITAARGRYVLMADADDSYNFAHIPRYLEKLREGNALVMGNRFAGGIGPGAMPLLHRYLGNPVLSFLGRVLFRAPIGDFHCGMRAFSRQGYDALGLRTTGMEFASEMVVKSSLLGQTIAEVPTTPAEGWTLKAATPQNLARRLAPPALSAHVFAALAVPCTGSSAHDHWERR